MDANKQKKIFFSYRYLAIMLVLCLVVQLVRINTVFAVNRKDEKVTASFTSVLDGNQEMITISADAADGNVEITGIKLPDGSFYASNEVTYAATENKDYSFEVFYMETVPLEKPETTKPEQNKPAGGETQAGDASLTTGESQAADESQTTNESPSDNQSQSDGASQTENQSQADGNSQPDGQSQADGDSLPDGQSQADGDSLPDGQSQADGDSLPDGQSQADGDSLPDGQSQADGDSLPDAQSQADGDSLPHAQSQADGDSLPDAQSQADGDSLPGAQSQADSDSLPDSQSQLAGESQPTEQSQPDGQFQAAGESQSTGQAQPCAQFQTPNTASVQNTASFAPVVKATEKYTSFLPQAFAAEVETAKAESETEPVSLSKPESVSQPEPESDSDSSMAVTEGSKTFTFTASKIKDQPKVTVQFSTNDRARSDMHTILIKAKGTDDDINITSIIAPDGTVTEGDTAQFMAADEGDYDFEVNYSYTSSTDTGREVFTYVLAASPLLSQDSDFTFDAVTQTIIGYNQNAGKNAEVPAQINGVDVLHIGANAFAGQQLSSITFPDGLLTIEENAFQNNALLTSIVLPDSLTSLGSSAFSGCSSLASINIPGSVAEIRDNTFSGCTNLTAIDIANGVHIIGSNAFEFCVGLKSITLPDSVTNIDGYGFQFCTSLADITLPNNITSIPGSMFRECKSLTNITIPDGVTSIGEDAFSYCSSLTSINIPNHVTTIGDRAFYESPISSITIPDRVTSIGDNAFNGCKSVHIPSKDSGSITGEPWGAAAVIWKDTMQSGDWLFNPATDTITAYLGNETVVTMPKSLENNGNDYTVRAFSKNTFKNSQNLQELIISANVTQIPERAFYGFGNLTSLILPDSVTSIGKSAFGLCSSLTNVHLPNTMISIGEGAFEYCSSLTSFTIPDGVTSIDNYTFEQCGRIESITIPPTVESIGDGAFTSCVMLDNVTIPDYVISIGSRAFEGCQKLSAITIPDKVADIGPNAFAACNQLASIQIPHKNSGSISGAPWGTGSNTTISWSDTLTIDSWLFDASTNTITKFQGTEPEVVMPKTLSLKGKEYRVNAFTSNVFKSNWNLTKLDILADISTIPDEAFYGCSNLQSINIPDSVTSIGLLAFGFCSDLNSISIPNSVTSIGRSAFSGCTDLTGISLPNSITRLGTNMFEKCSSLTNVTLPKGLAVIEAYMFDGCTQLKNIHIPENVATIRMHAFRGCTALTGITIPNSVTSIEPVAFDLCSSLTSITLPKDITRIWGGTFDGCTGLSGIIILGDITEIGSRAFGGCSSLTEITIPGSITSIDSSAFAETPALKKIRVMRERSSSPPSLTNSEPWNGGDPRDVKQVQYLGDFVSFEHSVEPVPGQYARNIQIHAFINTGTINQITLPDPSQPGISVAGKRWPGAGDYTYKVTAPANNKPAPENYVFKGIDASGEAITCNVFVGPIGQPTVTANDAAILASQAPALDEAAILALVNAKATTMELGNDFTGGTFHISDSDVKKVNALTTSGESAAITVTATSPTLLTDSVTVNIRAADTLTKSVTFITNGGEPVPPVQNVNAGNKITRPADPLKTGYTFDKWYRDAALQTPWDFDIDLVGLKNVTLYAGYTHKNYEVKFVDWNDTQIGKTQTVKYGQAAAAPAAPVREGYTFTGWDTPFDQVTKNLVVKAQYRQNTSGGGDHSGGNDGSGNNGGSNSGSNSGGNGGSNSGGNGGTITNYYTLSYETNGGSSIPSERAEEGSTVSLTKIPTKDGFTFDGWYSDAALADSITSVYMNQNKTVYASWTQEPAILPAASAQPPTDLAIPAVNPAYPVVNPAAEIKGDTGTLPIPETKAVPEITPERNGLNDGQALKHPEFGKDGGHRQCILHWILWLMTILLAIYTLFKRKKNKEELDKLFSEEEN